MNVTFTSCRDGVHITARRAENRTAPWDVDGNIKAMGDRAAATDLVGRAAQLAALHVAAEDLREVPRVALVAGEAGIGKSVLIERFAQQLDDRNVRVWVGGCVELAGDPIP